MGSVRHNPFQIEEKAGQWVWVVGGGILQLPLIREARRRGYKALVTDGNPEAPGAHVADAIFPISTYDIEQHETTAQDLAEWELVGIDRPTIKTPAAILTAGADVGPTVSAVAEVLGLPAAPLDVAMRCRNKALMRSSLDSPHPVYHIMPVASPAPDSVWEAAAWAKRVVPYPAVVKPLEECGSRGLSVATDAFSLRRSVKHAGAACRRGHDFCLVEQALRGPEGAMDFFVEGGEVVLANAAWRFFRRGRMGWERGHINPWHPPKEALKVAREAARKLGVTWGPFKVDVKNDPRYGWCVLEAATRLSGGFDHNCTAVHGPGTDVTGAMLDVALGMTLDRGKLKPRLTCDPFQKVLEHGSSHITYSEFPYHAFSCALAPDFAPGTVREWRLDEALEVEGVKDIIVLREHDIPPPEHCAARPLFVVASAPTWFGAVRGAVEAGRRVEVMYG